MTQVFFRYNDAPYMYDTKRLKLFQMKDKSLFEIVELKTMHNIRFKSAEIKRETALYLARKTTE